MGAKPRSALSAGVRPPHPARAQSRGRALRRSLCTVSPSSLTTREADVLEQLALGSSYTEIGKALYITENTVKHISHPCIASSELTRGRPHYAWPESSVCSSRRHPQRVRHQTRRVRRLGAHGDGPCTLSNFVFIPYYPLWSLLIIAVDVAVIWALAQPTLDSTAGANR